MLTTILIPILTPILCRRKEGRGNLLVTQCLVEDTPVLPRKVSVPGNYPGNDDDNDDDDGEDDDDNGDDEAEDENTPVLPRKVSVPGNYPCIHA